MTLVAYLLFNFPKLVNYMFYKLCETNHISVAVIKGNFKMIMAKLFVFWVEHKWHDNGIRPQINDEHKGTSSFLRRNIKILLYIIASE